MTLSPGVKSNFSDTAVDRTDTLTLAHGCGDHRQISVCGYVFGDAVTGAQRIAAPLGSAFEHLAAPLPNCFRRIPADKVDVDAPEDR